MLRVVYDGQIFASQSHGGVSRIFSQLITELQKNEIDVRILSLLTDNEYFNWEPVMPNCLEFLNIYL